MRISDWSSDVCSSDLGNGEPENDGVSMVKFDMGAAWDDAMTLVRAHLPLTGVLAGLFFFLPGIAAALLGPAPLAPPDNEIGRASGRERVCQYGEISVVAGSLKKKI